MSKPKQNCRIVLIHATAVSIEPIRRAFEEEWPEAETVNLLDDSLSRDVDAATSTHRKIEQRIRTLGDYALYIGADAILYSCSAFGREIETVQKQLHLPVLKPNEAMFEEALQIGGKLGMIATFGPSIPSMEKEFQDLAEGRGDRIQLDSLLVEEAMAALGRGDLETHNKMIADASVAFNEYDAVMLAQFSASQAYRAVKENLSCPVLTSPHSAVRKLKREMIKE